MSEEESAESEPLLGKAELRPDFAGWGTAEYVRDLPPPTLAKKRLHRLGEWKATAICGNDITSSCLYVSALCALYAGPYAPIALLLVAGVLYLFRRVYGEVGTALPLNGGAYNALLNTTSKGQASVAACLTLLSYIATAVISAYEAAHYAANLWHGVPVFELTLGILLLFAVLNIVGIGESAVVALGIFVAHIATLVVLVLVAAPAVIRDPSVLALNWSTPPSGGLLLALFFGFSAAMLGISGFESSANFIEEQEEGVFPKTLRNMWIAVAVFNPLLSLLSLGVLSLPDIGAHKEDLLAHLGLVAGGNWLRLWVSLDAVLVLSGAVLTSFVGVTGLVRRMSLDRCLPQFLLRVNRARATNHWIILLFLVLCYSILWITAGKIELLAGVYTLSFLGVMALFAIGNLLLKVKRARLPRDIRASWGAVMVAFVAVCAALVGNVLLNPSYVRVFLTYFGASLVIVGVMLFRVRILRAILMVSESAVEHLPGVHERILGWILPRLARINNQLIVYFTKGDSLAELNRVALYVLNNEQTNRLKVIHCFDEEDAIPADLAEQIATIDRLYPRLRIDLVLVNAAFDPEVIELLSQRLQVPKNYMFISTPGDHFPHNVAELGGVRLVI